jgi:hypothetical protein
MKIADIAPQQNSANADHYQSVEHRNKAIRFEQMQTGYIAS